MTKDEIQTLILNICKVPMHSGDFNIVAFDSFCNKLIELGAEKEREECAKLCEKLVLEDDSFYGEFSGGKDCAKAIRARGQE